MRESNVSATGDQILDVETMRCLLPKGYMLLHERMQCAYLWTTLCKYLNT